MRSLVFVLTAMAAYAGTAGTPYRAQVAPEPFAELLKQAVQEIEVESAFETRVNYKLVAVQRELVTEILASMNSVDPGSLGPKDRLAWAGNLYNLTVLDILGRHHAEVASISEIGDAPFSIFDAPLLTIAGEKLSLNQFERKYMMEGDTGDPRMHFAIVCGAKGCPPLWDEPLNPLDLDSQLDAMTANALANPRHLRIHGSRVRVNPLFDWYADDFGGESGILEFLRNHVPDLPDEPEVVADLEWDWSLNHQEQP